MRIKQKNRARNRKKLGERDSSTEHLPFRQRESVKRENIEREIEMRTVGVRAWFRHLI